MKRKIKATLLSVPLLFVLSACSYDSAEVTDSGENYLKETYPDKKLSIRGTMRNDPFMDKGFTYLVQNEETGNYFTVKSEELKTSSNRPFSDNLIQRENKAIETSVVNLIVEPLLDGVTYLVADLRVYDKDKVTRDNKGNVTSKGDISTTQPLTKLEVGGEHQVEGGTVHLIVSQVLSEEKAKYILDQLRTHFGDVTLTIYTYNSNTQVEYVRHLHSKEGVSIDIASSSHARVSSDMYYYDGKEGDLTFTHVEGVK